jgi:hypothetical protein
MLEQDEAMTWRERFSERFRSIIQEHQGDLWEFVAAGFSILWGLWVLNPYMDGMPREVAVYHILLAQAPEWFWGWLMVLFGFTRWWALFAFGKERTPRAILARRVTASMLGALYVWMQTMFFLGDPRLIGIFPMYQWVGALIAFWRAATPPKRLD